MWRSPQATFRSPHRWTCQARTGVARSVGWTTWHWTPRPGLIPQGESCGLRMALKPTECPSCISRSQWAELLNLIRRRYISWNERVFTHHAYVFTHVFTCHDDIRKLMVYWHSIIFSGVVHLNGCMRC